MRQRRHQEGPGLDAAQIACGYRPMLEQAQERTRVGLRAVRRAREDAHPYHHGDSRLKSVAQGAVEGNVHVARADAFHHDPVHPLADARAHEQVVHPLGHGEELHVFLHVVDL